VQTVPAMKTSGWLLLGAAKKLPSANYPLNIDVNNGNPQKNLKKKIIIPNENKNLPLKTIQLDCGVPTRMLKRREN